MVELLLTLLKNSCSFVETADVVSFAVSSLSALTSLYPTLMFTVTVQLSPSPLTYQCLQKDPLQHIKSIIETLCQNAIDSSTPFIASLSPQKTSFPLTRCQQARSCGNTTVWG